MYWLYAPMSGFIRISILLFYRRLFSPTMPKLGIVIWVLIVAQTLFTIAGLILPAVGPRPLYRMWYLRDATADDARGQYSNFSLNVGVTTFSINLAFDVILLILPMFPIATLRLPIRKKLGMAMLFILGAGYAVYRFRPILILSSAHPGHVLQLHGNCKHTSPN